MGFPPKGGAAIAVNGVVIDDAPSEVDFVDSGSATFLGILNGQVVEISAYTGSLTPGGVTPGQPGVMVSPGGTGALDTIGVISPYYLVPNYKTLYDNGFRLQMRGVWQVDEFIDQVGVFYDDGVNPPNFNLIRGYTPRLTAPQTVYTDWGIVDLPPDPGTTDIQIALGAGNNSFFFGWEMVGAWVEFRWVDSHVPDSFDGAQVNPGTVDGQIPIWVNQQEVYVAGTNAPEGTAVKSTGEGSGLVLSSDGADGAAWAAAGGANEGGVQAWRGTNQSIPDNTDTAINFGNKNYDTDGYAPGIGGGNFSTTVTIPVGKGGKYLVTFAVPFAASPGTLMSAYPELGAGGTFPHDTWLKEGNASGQTVITGAVIATLNAGDTVKLFCWQNSGGALDMAPEGGGVVSPNLTLARIGDN